MGDSIKQILSLEFDKGKNYLNFFPHNNIDEVFKIYNAKIKIKKFRNNLNQKSFDLKKNVMNRNISFKNKRDAMYKNLKINSFNYYSFIFLFQFLLEKTLLV